MTAQMMQYNFELKINSLHITDKPFSSTDINILLNKAQDIIVNDRYSSSVLTPRHFEMNEKTRVELGRLITNYLNDEFSTGPNRIQNNSVFIELPSDYMYSLTEKCVIGYENCNSIDVTGVARVLPITHDEYLMNKDNPFNKPNEKVIWRMDYSGDAEGTKKHELICNTEHSLINYNLRYIRRPVAINIITGIDCELHPELHEEIVDLAVNLSKNYIANNQKIQA